MMPMFPRAQDTGIWEALGCNVSSDPSVVASGQEDVGGSGQVEDSGMEREGSSRYERRKSSG